MRILDEELRQLATVLFSMFGNWVGNVLLLKEHIAGVGDVREHHLDVGIHPQLSLPREDTLVIERPPDLNPRCAVHVLAVHIADTFRLLRNNHEMSIYPFVAEHPHLTVGYALLETRNCTPFNIVRDAAAFLLCEGRQ